LSDRPKIVVAVGLPGSGKSTYFQSVGAHPVSSDAMRLQLVDDETDQTINGRVFSLVRYLLQQRIELGRPVTYVDATNLTRRERKVYIRMARQHGCAIEALWFDVPTGVCKIRNAARGRIVPGYVLDQMAAKLVPPSKEEGFDEVVRKVAVI
jgi:predicted kinase